MPLGEETFTRARGYERAGMEALLAEMYGAVHRMAYGLAGREDVGHGVVRFVMTQSLKRLESWRDAEAAERWFYHHTVLTARRAKQHEPGAKVDVLVGPAGGGDAGYVAFVRALRGLGVQQKEAFILHFGERLDERRLGVAMDCSTRAAQMHFDAAREALGALAGEKFEAYAGRLGEAYMGLTPADDMVRPSLKGYVEKALWPRRVKRVMKIVVAVALAAGLGVAYLKLRHLWQ